MTTYLLTESSGRDYLPKIHSDGIMTVHLNDGRGVLCDGRAVSRIWRWKLFRRIGTRYGRGNGITTFNVPDARKHNFRPRPE